MAPTVEFAQLEGDFRNALESLQTGIEKIEGAFQRLIDKINQTLKRVAFFSAVGALYLSKRLGDAVRELASLIRAFLDKCREVLNQTSAREGVVATDATDNLANWKGQAEAAYRRKVVLQKTAVGGMSGNADAIGSWLVDLGTANIAFVVAMVDPLAPLAAKLAEATIDAGSVFGALEAIDSAAEAVGKIIEIAWAELKSQVAQFTTLVNNMFKADKIINDNGPFPSGHWPQAVGTY